MKKYHVNLVYPVKKGFFMNAKEIIDTLKLEPLEIEGGFFREIYRSKLKAEKPGRMCGTSIYYLMTSHDISRWHKVTGDEIWHYHGGSPAVQLLIHPGGRMEKRVIGLDLKAGQVPQSLIPADTWQAAVLLNKNEDAWGLFGATVFPSFEYEDFSGATVEQMTEKFPSLEKHFVNFFKRM